VSSLFTVQAERKLNKRVRRRQLLRIFFDLNITRSPPKMQVSGLGGGNRFVPVASDGHKPRLPHSR